MQGCRERGGVYIQRIEKSTALDQVWHGFMAPEPLGFGGLGQRKCASQQRPPSPLARAHHDGIARQEATRTPTVILWGAAILIKEVRA